MGHRIAWKKAVAVVTAFLLFFGGDRAFAAQEENNQAESVLESLAYGDNMVSNFGTVKANYGLITYNYGTVENNYGTVNFNAGTITNNYGSPNSLGMQGGTVVNDWNRLDIVNTKACGFSVESTGNYHVFTTDAILNVTEGTAAVTPSAIGYELEAQTNIKIELSPQPQYTFTTACSFGGEAQVRVNGEAVSPGAIVLEGSTLEITAKANNGFRCGNITIAATQEDSTQTVQPCYYATVQGLPLDSEDLASIGNILPEIEIWRLTVYSYMGKQLEFDEYRWQKSTDLSEDDYGFFISSGWEDIPGGTTNELLLNASEIYDPYTYEYCCDYRVLVRSGDEWLCPYSMLQCEYEPETVPEEINTEIAITDFCTEYTAEYQMTRETANIFCDFVPIVTVKSEDLNIIVTANTGADRELVVSAGFMDPEEDKYEFVTESEQGFTAVSPGAVVLRNGESAELSLRPTNNLSRGMNKGYVRISSYIRAIKTSPETADTYVLKNPDNYVLLRTELNPVCPSVSAVEASAITYGQALTESTITGTATADGQEVSGHFYLQQADLKPNVSKATYEAVFVPDSPYYDEVRNIPVMIEVLPTTLIVTTQSATAEYTGTPVTAGGTYTGLVNGETLSFSVTGSQTSAGSSPNTYKIVWDGTALESNYVIEEHIGTLTVNETTPGGGTSGGGTTPGGGGTSGGGTTPGGGSTSGGGTTPGGGGTPGEGTTPGGGGTSEGGTTPGGDINPIGEDTNPPEEDVNPIEEDINPIEEDINPAEEDAGPVEEDSALTESGSSLPEEDTQAAIVVNENTLSDGNTFSEYDITSSKKSKAAVSYAGQEKSQRTIAIPDVVTAGGITYKVTRVAAKALKGNKKVVSLTLGANIAAVDKYAFKDCTKLKEVVLGDNVKRLYRSAFCGCTRLKSIEIGSNLTHVYRNSFRDCKALETIELPDTLSYIGPTVFYGCEGLKSLTINSTLLTSANVKSKAFTGVAGTTVIYVPEEKVKEYTKLFRKKGLDKSVTIKAIPKK